MRAETLRIDLSGDFYSDSGLPCHCGGTTFAYRGPDQMGKVETRCFACYAGDYFFVGPSTKIETAEQMSAAHRRTRDGAR